MKLSPAKMALLVGAFIVLGLSMKVIRTQFGEDSVLQYVLAAATPFAVGMIWRRLSKAERQKAI